MEWTSIITAFITNGAFLGIFMIAERKAAAAIRNSNEQYRVLKEFCEDLQARYDRETDKVGRLYDEIAGLHRELDCKSTEAAVASVMRCDTIECAMRRPPLGTAFRQEQKKTPGNNDIV